MVWYGWRRCGDGMGWEEMCEAALRSCVSKLFGVDSKLFGVEGPRKTVSACQGSCMSNMMRNIPERYRSDVSRPGPLARN